MIDFYCNSTGIGDSLLHTQAVHELAKKDNVVVHVQRFAWHGKRYKNGEDRSFNPIWKGNQDIQALVLEEKFVPGYGAAVSGRQHHAVDICHAWGCMDIREPKLYLNPGVQFMLPTKAPNVGIFLRKIEDDSDWNYKNFLELTEILSANGVEVYQIDAEAAIIHSANQTFKELSVHELCGLVGKFDCVIGTTTGCTHIAKALEVKCFDIWDWKRFKQFTPHTYAAYSYKENYNFTANGPTLPNSKEATVIEIFKSVFDYLEKK